MKPAEVIRRRNLPHWDVSGAAYFLTTCLEGSIPAQGLLDLENYRAELQRRPRPESMNEQQWALDRWKLAFGRTERWLDQNPGCRHLEDPRLACVVVNALYHFAARRYDLLAFVVMPSHYHWVFQRRSSTASTATRPWSATESWDGKERSGSTSPTTTGFATRTSWNVLSDTSRTTR